MRFNRRQPREGRRLSLGRFQVLIRIAKTSSFSSFLSVSRRGISVSGFTLIELLVVVAIIALLASLLLPALSHAKTHAQGIKCLGNLKQMTLAWTMYADENQDHLVWNSGNHAQADWESWVRGELTLDNDFNWIATSFPASDSTNVLYLNRSPLAPYGTAPGLWRCPSDRSTRTIGGQRCPRVRSLSMNCMLGSTRVPLSAMESFWWPWSSRRVRRTSEFRNPGPAQCFVFLDEREDSICPSYFLVSPIGLRSPPAAPDPADPAQYRLMNYPGSYHHGAGNLSYADGHVEARKWLDPRTRPPLVKDLRLPTVDPQNGFPSPRNPDVHWLQERTFQRGN